MNEGIYWPSFFFLLFAGLCGAFAIAVLLSSNIVRMAFYLVMSLASSAGLFFLAGADFVGAMQLMIYVGGTLVLLVFGVMLTSQDRFVEMKTSAGDWIYGFIAGLALLILLGIAAFSNSDWRGLSREQAEKIAVAPTATPIAMALTTGRVDAVSEGAVSEGGRGDAAVSSAYLLHFEIVSVHLLVVLVGAAYLARAKSRRVSLKELGSAPL